MRAFGALGFKLKLVLTDSYDKIRCKLALLKVCCSVVSGIKIIRIKEAKATIERRDVGKKKEVTLRSTLS